MNILFISPYLPYETSGQAGAQKVFRNIKVLASQHTVKVVTFFNLEESDKIQKLEAMGVIVIPVLYDRNRTGLSGIIKGFSHNIFPIIKSILGDSIFFIAKYNRTDMRRILIKIKSTFKPDIVQFEYNVMHHYADLFPNVPKILVQHDISTKVYEMGAVKSQTKIGRRKNYQLFKLANKSESQWMNKFDHIITLTEEDKKYCSLKWNEIPHITVIPPSIIVKEDIDIKKNKYELCFVGSFNREPNLQAVEILLDDIFPIVNEQYPDATLKIAGKYLPQSLIDKINKNDKVFYEGFVKNIDSFISKSSLFIAPIKIGSGLKMKITHALSCGTAVLTTPIGAEGISIKDDKGLFIEQSDENIIEQCICLLQTPDSLAEVGKRGKMEVQKLFSEEIISNKYIDLYKKMLSQ